MHWRHWIAIGGVFGGLSVILGAFAAHALKEKLGEQEMSWFQTATHYQSIHALAIVSIGLLGTRIESTSLSISGFGFALGIIVFSGSLYGMALGLPRWLGMITPIGGLAMIVGWCSLIYAVEFPN